MGFFMFNILNMLNADHDFDVGNRLRSIRERSGLSQRSLAKKTGVPNSTISLIEAGKTSPSVSALRRILSGIPIGLSEFFADEPEKEQQIFFTAESLPDIGKGKLSLKQVGNDLLDRAMMILHETYEIGADTGRKMYVHDGEEGGVVISGRIEVTVGEERKILGPGDAYYFQSKQPHRFKQVGPDPCILVSASTPPSF